MLVARQSDGSYAVKVRGPKFETSHVVTVPNGLGETVGADSVPPEELVRASFMFLLDREPANAILPRFGLDVIGRYFPEYAGELGKYLGARKPEPS